MNNNGRMVIVSNRLPIVISKEKGQLNLSMGSGGLITALRPVLQNKGGLWIGWPGPVKEEERDQISEILEKKNCEAGFSLHPIFLTEQEIKLYYEGFANEVIWPLFHDLQSECVFDPSFWHTYQDVNRKFAQGIHKLHKPTSFYWIHDYHLMLVGQELRSLGVHERMGFFLHTPFPSPDVFLKLPWRFQILRGLLEYDLVGFQMLRDQRNFVQCVKKLLPEIKMINKHQLHICQARDREVRVGVFPISIDFQEFAKMAEGNEVANQAGFDRKHLDNQVIIFSCDRLDITKGITYRLEAIRHLLKHHQDIHGKVTFFQVIIPSRTELPKYKNLKKEIDSLVSEINSEFATTGWVPIQYLYHSISRKELLAYYRISDVALITPVKDGMNLVAKEYVASNVNENGVLILSEFAGAATQLQHEAILINPYDIEGLSEAIYTALMLPVEERKKRMRKMRNYLRKNDVYHWVRGFLDAAISKEPHEFTLIEEYIPSEKDEG